MRLTWNVSSARMRRGCVSAVFGVGRYERRMPCCGIWVWTCFLVLSAVFRDLKLDRHGGGNTGLGI